MAVAKKSTTAKPTNPASTLHPPYFQMISEALTSLKDRTGSSQPAIAKFIEEKYPSKLPPNFKKLLSVQLKKFVKSEKLFKMKNSYKMSSSEKVKLSATSTKESGKKNGSVMGKTATVAAKKVSKHAAKTKRLSQVKTPDALKKKSTGKAVKMVAKKSPVGMKKKKPLTPAKRKASKSVQSAKPTPKKAKK